MNNINLIIPGAAKSATSSLHEYLNQHPEINMAKWKEPHFFSIDERYNEGVEFYKRRKVFSDTTAETKYLGESSTSYLISKKAAERINHSLKDCKIIILLRDPYERILSHYNYIKSFGIESRPFVEAILEDKKVAYDANVYEKGVYKSYFEYSNYPSQVKRFYDQLGKENVKIIFSEDLKKNYESVVNSCFEFLNIDTIELEEVSVNVTKQRKIDITPIWFNKIRKHVPQRIKNKFNQYFNLSNRINKYFQEDFVPYIPKDREKQIIVEKIKPSVVELEQLIGTKITQWNNF